MDAKELLVAVRNECRKYNSCSRCPLNKTLLCNDTLEGFSKMTNQDIENTIQTVKKIAYKMTYAEDFFERNPEARRNEDGTPEVCRERVYKIRYPGCGNDGGCCRCWKEPMPEENNE